jgi:hypothetical protein
MTFAYLPLFVMAIVKLSKYSNLRGENITLRKAISYVDAREIVT